MRSGAQTLVLLSLPLNASILPALANGRLRQAELRRIAGSPAQTTLRAQLKRLTEIGAIEKHRRNRFPGVLEYELTASGHELLTVLRVLERWLGQAPGEPLAIGDNQARTATKALAEAWSATMLRALAVAPLSLTELDVIIKALSYPSLERRLAALRHAGLVEACPSGDRGTPYGVTKWLRRGIAPLAAATRWERRNMPQATPPVGQLDIETALLLATALMQPRTKRPGTCRLAVEIGKGGNRHLAGVLLTVRSDGSVASNTTNLEGDADAWALGSTAAWLAAVVERDTAGLELGGDHPLARGLAESLHDALFGVPIR
jgi:DNA-binding HxlR family transcriptional regulator